MVYKKYLKKGGKTFGPYYYESYREGNHVKKVYIGGEKEYKQWLRKKTGNGKKKNVVEQPSRKGTKAPLTSQTSSKLGKIFFFVFLVLLLGLILSNFGNLIL